MKNNYQTLDEMLNSTHGKKTVTKPVKAPKVKKVKQKKEKTKKSKKFVVGMVALIAAGAIALTSGVATIVNHFKKKNNDVPKTPNNSIVQIDDMGTELEFVTEDNSSKYGNTTGNVDPNKIVEKNDKLYVDKDSADKSNKVGTEKVDTKGNTLVVEDGKVKDKNQGYEIKDDTGKVIQKGELDDNKIPEGYAWDSVLKKYVPKAEVGKYVYADATYYDEEGNVVINKGEVVAKETLEKAKKYLTTTKKTSSSSNTNTSSTTTSSTTNTSSKTETSSTTTTSNEGKVNANGTYTIFGLTFETKADYEQWVIQGYEGYAEADGIMKPEQEILKQIQKVK